MTIFVRIYAAEFKLHCAPVHPTYKLPGVWVPVGLPGPVGLPAEVALQDTARPSSHSWSPRESMGKRGHNATSSHEQEEEQICLHLGKRRMAGGAPGTKEAEIFSSPEQETQVFPSSPGKDPAGVGLDVWR